jgi:hypothetical protein
LRLPAPTTMTFLTKYELLQPVTGGAVETFIARDIASGQRVLVRVFDGLDVSGDQSPTQWALQSYRVLAPPLAGELIDGGRYKQTPKAYLISKFPADHTALRDWIRLYQLHARETQGSARNVAPQPQADFLSGQDTPTRNQQPDQIAGAKGDQTKAFLGATTADVEAQNGAKCPEKADREPLPSDDGRRTNQATGAFTREFFSGLDGHPYAETPAAPKALEPQKQPGQAKSFTSEFFLAQGNNPSPQSDPGGLGRNSAQDNALPLPPSTTSREGADSRSKGGTGEFTKFFRGPFNAERSASLPTPIPETVDQVARNQERGEFTRVFGSGKTGAPPEVDPIDLVEPSEQREPGTVTRLFGSHGSTNSKEEPEPLIGAPLRSLEPSSQDQGQRRRWDESSPDLRAPARENISSYPPEVPAPQYGAFSGVENTLPGPSSQSDGATQVFTPKGSRSVSDPEPIAAGPSPYTVIISGPSPPPDASQPSPFASAAPSPNAMQAPPSFVAQVPVVRQPRMPSTPAVLPSQFPPSMQYPQMQYPPAPQGPISPPNLMTPPQMPPTPQPRLPLPARVSYWPLVIALNILFIAAVLLVLYFALKS